MPWNEQIPGVQVPQPAQNVLAQLQKIFQAQAQARQNRPGQSTPPLVPPPVSLPQPGGLPGMSAPMGMPSQMQMPPRQNVTPLNPQVDGFSSKGAARANTVQNFVTGLGELLTQSKNRKEVHEQRRAEGYFNQIQQALERGENPNDPNSSLYILLTDPKVIKSLEKGLDYYMPKEPGEPPPPEAKALHKILNTIRGKQQQQQASLPAPNTPGGVRMPQASQAQQYDRATADMVSKARYEALQKDPARAAQLGLGTTLSSSQAQQADLIAAGLGLSKAQVATLELDQQKAFQQFEEFNTQMRNQLKVEAMRVQGDKDVARIHAGPLYERAKIAGELGKAQLEMRKEIAKGNVSGASKVAISALSRSADSLMSDAEKARKDGRKDDADRYEAEAGKLRQQVDDINAASQVNVDDLIKEIMSQP